MKRLTADLISKYSIILENNGEHHFPLKWLQNYLVFLSIKKSYY